MDLQAVLAKLAAFAPLIEQGLMALEPQAVAELNALIANISSPDLKALLSAMVGAIDAFAKVEIQKLA